MRATILILSASIVSLCGGCVNTNETGKQKISVVANLALDHAKKDSINLEEHSLQSIRQLRDDRQSAVHESTDTKHFSSAQEKLKGKKYWEACYRVSADLAAGAIYCYYFEDPNLNYLTAYRVK